LNELTESDREKLSGPVYVLLMAALLLVALGLRVYRLGVDEMWLDETLSAVAAMGSPGDILGGVYSPKSPPLYYLLLWCWVRVFGISEIAVRGLSVLSGVALVGCVGACGTKLFSRRAGITAAAFAAFAPLGINYSQEARSYMLLAIFALGYLYFTLRLADGFSAGRVAGFVLTGCGLSLTHAYGFVLLPLPNIIFLAKPARAAYVRLMLAELPVAACALCMWMLMESRGEVRMALWLKYTWDAMGPLGSAYSSLQSLGVGGAYPKLVFRLWQPPAAYINVPAVILVVSVAVYALARKPEDGAPASRGLARYGVAAAIFFPLFAVLALSIAWKPVYLAGRTEIIAAPAFWLLIGAGLARLKPKTLVLAGAVLFFFASYNLIHFYERDAFGARRAVATHIAAETGPPDPVICGGGSCVPLKYYLTLHGEPRELVWFPSLEKLNRYSYDPDYVAATAPGLEEEARVIASMLAKRIKPGAMVLMVGGGKRFDTVNEWLFVAMMRRFDLVKITNRENGLPVYHFRRKDG